MEYKIYSIKEITKYINNLLSEDSLLKDLWVTGEVSNFYHHNSGHMYFTLKDDSACLKSIMFQGNNRNLKFEIEEGLKVTAHGYIGVYAPRGDYQFYIDKIEPEGKGALYLAYKQLKEKLDKEGLFAEEAKKPIPLLPKKIGVITSPTGAAIKDILSVAKRRFENISILVVPSLVQGDKAAEQIVAGLKYLNKRNDIDIIIVSRGGGSIEDLWPFNEEIVARAIYDSQIPVISGVGHETDFTISDFVADMRAPTPSAAAEQALARRKELENHLNNLQKRIYNNINNKLQNYREKINSIISKQIFIKPEILLSDHLQKLDYLSRQLGWNTEKVFKNFRQKCELLGGKLDTLSPLKTLKRGYSISSKEDGKIITSIRDVKKRTRLKTRLIDGLITSTVNDIKEKGEDNE